MGCVEGKMAVRYFGPPPDPGPAELHLGKYHWVTTVMRQIPNRCTGNCKWPKMRKLFWYRVNSPKTNKNSKNNKMTINTVK